MLSCFCLAVIQLLLELGIDLNNVRVDKVNEEDAEPDFKAPLVFHRDVYASTCDALIVLDRSLNDIQRQKNYVVKQRHDKVSNVTHDAEVWYAGF